MPRTKRPTGKGSKAKVTIEIPAEKNNVANRSETQIEDIEKEFSVMMEDLHKIYLEHVQKFECSIRVVIMKMTPNQLDSVPRDYNVSMETTVSVPDIVETAQNRVPTRRVMRSNNMMPPPAIPNRFRTPNCNIAPDGNRYNMITPKVQPNCPISILRRPQEGEIAFALSGSPLLVSSRGNDDVANINIPLAGGKVLSILPQTGMRPYDVPDMGVDMMQQLQNLRDNIDMIIAKK